MTIFSNSPYFDDFAPEKNFYKLLFRPGYAVQTRELNQIQSTLQNQVQSIGNHLFKEGSMVIPGYFSCETKVDCIKLQAANSLGNKISGFIGSFEGTILTGATSGATALVIHAEPETTTDPNTLYIRYIYSGSTNVKFIENELLVNDATTQLKAITYPTACNASGSLAMLQAGIYYIKGYFVVVDKYNMVLDKYGNVPSYKVGLKYTEDVLTSDDDYTLNDNAIGAYNFNAPGANRYKISTTLVKVALDSTNNGNFVELLRINAGNIESIVTKTEYSVLEETLARRTYDESGDYVINPFKFDIRENRNNFRGARKNTTSYIIGDIITASGYSYVCTAAGISDSALPSYITTFGSFNDGTVTWDYTESPVYNKGIHLAEVVPATNEAKLSLGIEEGKAYVKGFEILKKGTTFIDIPKARKEEYLNSVSVSTSVGNYVVVKNLLSIPDGLATTFPVIQLYDSFTATGGSPAGNLIGTANLRFIENDSISGQYKVFICNVKMNNGYSFNSNVRQLYYNNTTNFDFTADVVGINTQMSGTITASAAAFTASLAATGNQLSVTAITAGPILIGQTITSGTVAANTVITGFVSGTNGGIGVYTVSVSQTVGSGTMTVAGTSVVGRAGSKFSTQFVVGDYLTMDSESYYKITTINNDSSLVTSVALPTTAIDKVYYKQATSIVEQGNFSGLIPLPNSYIRKLRSADNATIDTRYSITRTNAALTSDGTGTIVWALTTPGESFESKDNTTNYLVIKNTDGTIATGATLTITSGTILTITGLSNSISYTILGTITKTAQEKTKILTLATKDVTVIGDVQNTKIMLPFADIYKIVSIKAAPAIGVLNAGNVVALDITDNYILDAGVRDSHYELGSITLKPGYFPPNTSIRIVYQYFQHQSGDYASIDSYNIPYSTIESTIRDSIDFRPITNSSNVITGTNIGIIKRGYNVSVDYSYYLSRVDVVSLTPDGTFVLTMGTPALNPFAPNVDNQGMRLYTIQLNPYTLDANSKHVNIIQEDNRRYTMRDIGKLENRIKNIEYYTSLSLLEQETKSLSIPDSNGLERYKNGFLVDSFSDHGIGDVNSIEYSCAIDAQNNELRPMHNVSHVPLLEVDSSNNLRASHNYRMTGDIITLPYTDSLLIDQPFASRTENVNPFAFFTFIGNTTFTPASDDWFENVYAPDIVIRKEGNYDLTKATLSSSGILGNKWGAWQSSWTGTTVNDAYARHGGGNWALTRAITIGTTTKTIQSRTGINTSLVAKFDNTTIDDKVLATAVIPYMRSRKISFVARGLKPNTIFYPYFDQTPIKDYITPATEISFTAVLGTTNQFDYTTNVGSNSIEIARKIGGVITDILTKGDVITGISSGATAVLALQYNSVTGTNKLYVNNITGIFTNGETIVGSVSGAKGIISSTVVVSSIGNTLLSNASGDIVGIFDVPSNSQVRFRTGKREFILSTSPINSSDYTSIAKNFFSATGILQTRQKTIESVRNAELVNTNIASGDQTIYVRGKTTVTQWYDPLAQTFLIDQSGGAFITKIDIFFASKDTSIPVKMQIRNVENGYPGQTIIPFSEVLMTPDNVILATDTVIDPTTGKSYSGAGAATTFVFPSPVYLQDKTEYAIVLISDSINYNVWISNTGDKQIDSDEYISKQPYAGVLFKSQNASTWTAFQTQDMKFKIHRAKFDTGITGNASFTNNVLPTVALTPNPIQTKNGSTTVRVYHYNHGMVNGNSVILSGIAAGNTLVLTELNATKVISNVDMDSYTVTVTTAPTVTGFTGGSVVSATANVKYDLLNINATTQIFSDTGLDISVKTTNTAGTLDTGTTSIILGKDTIFNDSRIVASQINETLGMSSAKSFTLSAQMITNNDAVSPVIDVTRFSMLGVANRIAPSPNLTATSGLDYNIANIDYRAISAPSVLAITLGDTKISTATAGTQTLFKGVVAGKYMTLSGTNAAKKLLIKSVASDGSYIEVDQTLLADTAGTFSITLGEYYISEIAPINSSGVAKYVTKIVTLANNSTSFKVMFAYNMPSVCGIEVYYRIGNTSALDSLVASSYTKLVPSSSLVTSSDYIQFIDGEYIATTSAPFNAIQVKLVMTSTSTAKVPRLKDFRLIALA